MEGGEQQCFDTTGPANHHQLPNIPAPATTAPEPPATTTTIPEQFTLPPSKALDLIGEEFVVRSLKTEPSDAATLSTEPALASSSMSRPSVVMSVSTAAAQAESASPVVQAREVADQSNLVYCNLNDLDFAAGPEGGVYTMGGSGGLSNMQEMVITSSNAGLLQMVQSVPCLQVTYIDVDPHPGFILSSTTMVWFSSCKRQDTTRSALHPLDVLILFAAINPIDVVVDHL